MSTWWKAGTDASTNRELIHTVTDENSLPHKAHNGFHIALRKLCWTFLCGWWQNRSVYSLIAHIRSVLPLIIRGVLHSVHVNTHYQLNTLSCEIIFIWRAASISQQRFAHSHCYYWWFISHLNQAPGKKSQGRETQSSFVVLMFRKNAKLTTDQPRENVLMFCCLRISAGGRGINNQPSPIRLGGPSTLRNETTSITPHSDSIPLNPHAQFKRN